MGLRSSLGRARRRLGLAVAGVSSSQMVQQTQDRSVEAAPVDRATIMTALADARPLQSDDVWGRYRIHRADGSQIGMVSAINDIHSRLARMDAEIVSDVWGRYRIRRPDGSTVGVLEALGEMHTRLSRMEAKLERLLGAEVAPPPAATPVTRVWAVPLPQSAPVTLREGVPNPLVLRAHWSMFVPRVFAERGVGGIRGRFHASLPRDS